MRRTRVGLLVVLAVCAACGQPAPPPRVVPVGPAPAPDVAPPPAAPDAGAPTSALVDALAMAAPPPGFAAYPGEHDLEADTKHCGDHEVAGGGGQILIRRGGRVRHRVRGANIELADWCFDVTGDGIPELHLRGIGTVHEPVHHVVLSLGPTVRTVVDVELESNHALGPVDAGSGAPWPLVGRDRVDTAGDLCEAMLDAVREPVIFAWRRGRYERATTDFPDLLRAIRAAALASVDQPDLRGRCQSRYDVLAISLALGDWPAVRETLAPPLRARIDAFRAARQGP